MKTYQLLRNKSTDQGTTGLLWRDDFSVKTIELPWRNNQHDISCIPVGEYMMKPYLSFEHGQCLMLEGVPDRTLIEFHKGNWAGDEEKGYKTDSEGCIIVGLDFGVLDNQTAVLSSKVALKLLAEEIIEPANLMIIWQEDI